MPMARLLDIDEEKLSGEQREVYNRIKSVRSPVRGLAEKQDLFAVELHARRRLVQLMILVSARLSSTQMAWLIHERDARELGILPRSSSHSRTTHATF
jgi:hypothetical protein